MTISGVEDELKLAQKALKTQKEVDGRAVKVAGKMQKEVTEKRSQIDTLNTKVRWLEESLDNILKVNSYLDKNMLGFVLLWNAEIFPITTIYLEKYGVKDIYVKCTKSLVFSSKISYGVCWAKIYFEMIKPKLCSRYVFSC